MMTKLNEIIFRSSQELVSKFFPGKIWQNLVTKLYLARTNQVVAGVDEDGDDDDGRVGDVGGVRR